MKKWMLLIALAAVVANFPQSSFAQAPYIQIYFDENLQRTVEVSCPDVAPPAEIGTLYIAAHNFNIQMSSIEYRVDYPPELVFVQDSIDASYQVAGESWSGIVISFPSPLDAHEAVLLERVIFEWACIACETTDIRAVVVPHPASGKIRAISWPDSEEVEAVGMTAIVCPLLPVENSTWGHVKALYR